MRLSSIIRVGEDLVLGAGAKLATATKQLADDLALEANARRLANVELRAQKQQMIEDFREAILATDARYVARRAQGSEPGTTYVNPDADLGGC